MKKLTWVASLCSLMTLSTEAVARSWTGDGPLVGGVYRVWSDPDNWDPHGIPQNGEDLYFSDPLSPDINMLNDLTNLTVKTLSFNIGDIGDVSVHLYGNTLGVSHGISNTNDFECQVYIHCGLTLAGNATFVTGNTETQPFAGEDTAMHIIGPVDLNGRNLLIYADASYFGSPFGQNSGRMFIEGGISGVGNVLAIAGGIQQGVNGELNGEGSVEFKGVGNSFTGTLTLNCRPGSEIFLDVSSGVVVNNLLIVTNVGTVKYNRANQIGDVATVRLQDGAMLELNGYDDTIQHLELVADSNDSRPAVLHTFVPLAIGTLSVSGNIKSVCNSGSVTPAIVGRLNLLSGSHDINVSGSSGIGLDMQAEMQGFGNFSKSGNSALILQSSNSFNSTISILDGILDVRNNQGLGDIAGSTELFGGGLVLRNVAIGEELLSAIGRGTGGELPGSVLTSIGISSWAGQVSLNTNLVVNGDITFTGPISGIGGMGCFGGGTIRLGGTLANTYTGVTLARCPWLELNKPFDVNAFSGPLVVGGTIGATVEVRWLNSFQCAKPTVTLYPNALINLNGFNEDFGPINFNGGTISTGTGLLGINGLVSVYPSTFGSTLNGQIFLPAGYREFDIYFGDGRLNLGATVSGPGHLQKTGGGELRMSSANSYSGLTLVEEGLLTATHPAALGVGDPGTIVADAATLQLLSVNGVVSERISLRGSGAAFGHGALTVIGNVTLRSQFPSIYACLDLTTNAVITVDPGAQVIADGFISGVGPLIKNGSGSLVFSNSNPNIYTGDTIVSAGTLELRKPLNTIGIPGNLIVGPALASSPATVRWFQTGGINVNSNVTANANSLLDLNGNNQTLARLNLNDGGDVQTGSGQLNFTAGGVVTVGTLNSFPPGLFASSSISGKIGLPASDYLTFNVGGYGPAPLVPDPELVVSASISGAGNILKNGLGGILLSGNNTFNATQQILAGDVIVNSGTLLAGSATALGGVDGWTYVNNDASLALINGITINNETLYLNSTRVPSLDNRGGDNAWSGLINLSRDSVFGVNQDWSLQTLGVISGIGSLTKIGAGTLRIGGTANNTHGGNTFVHEGTLLLAKSSSLQAVPNDLIVGSGQPDAPSTLVRYLGHDLVWNRITVNRNGLLDLNGFNEFSGDLTLNGGGDVQTAAGTFYLGTGANLAVNPGTANNPSTITGNLILYGGQHLFTINGGVTTAGQFDLNLQANVYQISGSASILKLGGGSMRLGGTNDYRGLTYVSSGTLHVDGLQPRSTIELDHETRLQGSGTVGHVLLNGGAIGIAPGSSAGTLTSSNFVASGGNGILEMELNSFPSGYDQLNVRGTVDLIGLTLKATLNFASAPDNEFTLINNDGADPVIGTFNGLPEKKKLYVGSELFYITYTGGNGNDVVLGRLATPPSPTLSIQRISPVAVRLFWASNDPPFQLQFNTNLTTNVWATITPGPSVSGTNFVVTNGLAGVQKFYRLINP